MRVFNTDEAADLLRCSKVTLYRLFERRELGHFRAGRRIMVTDAHIEQYINAHETLPVTNVGAMPHSRQQARDE